MAAERVGIVGGTFDPPHKGHMYAASEVKEALSFSRVIFVPTSVPPHKALPDGAPSAEQRLEMTRIAADSELSFEAEVSDTEISRGGVSYTVDTLEYFAKTMPDAELWLVMGSDMIENFPTWRSPERIAELASLAVMCREKGEYEKVRKNAEKVAQRFNARVEFVPSEPFPASSTNVRAALKWGIKPAELPDDVFSYIEKNGLYSFDRELFNMRSVVKSRLTEKRFRHTLGCEKCAAELAVIWGEDERDARMAAILHDITKYLSRETQLNLCEERGIMNETLYSMPDALLHSITGASEAEKLFGVPERVKNAIRWHTTGHENMTMLEKIVCLADTIEETRSFPGVEELRAAAHTDINAALIRSLEGTLSHLRSLGETPHPETLRALASLYEHNA